MNTHKICLDGLQIVIDQNLAYKGKAELIFDTLFVSPALFDLMNNESDLVHLFDNLPVYNKNLMPVEVGKIEWELEYSISLVEEEEEY